MARIDSKTKKRIIEGYCLFDNYYYENEEDLIDELRELEHELRCAYDNGFHELDDGELLERAYDKGWYYWTEWDDECEEYGS